MQLSILTIIHAAIVVWDGPTQFDIVSRKYVVWCHVDPSYPSTQIDWVLSTVIIMIVTRYWFYFYALLVAWDYRCWHWRVCIKCQPIINITFIGPHWYIYKRKQNSWKNHSIFSRFEFWHQSISIFVRITSLALGVSCDCHWSNPDEYG